MSWAELTPHLPAVATAAGGLGMGGLLKTWLDHKRAGRRQADEVAMGLVEQLSARIATVETAAAQERALCDANLSVLRHRVNNLSGSFDGMLFIIEFAPDRAPEIVARVKEQRAAQERAEAAEKASVAAAAIAITAPKDQVQ